MAVEQTQRTFQDIQAEYDQLYQTIPVRDEDRAYQWLAKRLLRAKPSLRHVLDIACGGGYFLREVLKAAENGLKITGTDLSGYALKLAHVECPSANYALSAAEALPFRSQVFDGVTCLGSLEHFLDLPNAVQEMKRITSRDGIFFILVPNIFWYKDIVSVLFTGDRKTRNQTHERFASLGEGKEVLEDLGLKVVRSEKYNGIAKSPFKQWLKDLFVPLRFSYHFLFICRQN